MRMKCFIGFILWAIVSTGIVCAQELQEPLTVEESIKIAMERSLTLHSAVEGVAGSDTDTRRRSNSFPYGRDSTPWADITHLFL